MYNQVAFFRDMYERQYAFLPANPKGTFGYERYALQLRKALAEWAAKGQESAS